MSTPFTLGQVFYDHGNAFGDPDLGGHTTDGGRVTGFTRARYAECDGYHCQPVVVIDPEDRDQAAALAVAFFHALGDTCNVAEQDDAMQAALRSLIADPRPEEPTGLGAVVEDAEGHNHVRSRNHSQPWCGSDGVWRPWLGFRAVTVLSEGVQP